MRVTTQLSQVSAVPLLTESCNSGQFSLFPGESGGGVTITQDEMLQLSDFYSRLYEIYISRLSAQLSSHFDITMHTSSLLARRSLVPLIHCFMDRLIRVKKAIDCVPGRLTTPRQYLFPATDTIEEFEENAVANPEFNQSMIWFVGKIWQLPESAPVSDHPQLTLQEEFRNNSFRLYQRVSRRFIRKFKRAWFKLLASLPRSRFPTLTMAYARTPLLDHGFYSKYLGEVNRDWLVEETNADRIFREQLFTDDFIESIELRGFLIRLGLKDREQNCAQLLLKEFIQYYYPSSLLEAIPQNMKSALRALKPFKKAALVSSGEAGGTRSIYVMAAAKQASLFIVKGQHGGHYGYIEDMRVFMELLYPGADQFVSWGWSRLPPHPAIKGLSVIALPSPWLSERKHYWEGLQITGEKEFDFLLMPNMVKRFPAAPHGASTSRIDLIQETAASLVCFVRKATENGFKILHKPYNPTTVKLLTKTMKELESVGGARYSCMQKLDKGLTHELVRRCHVVLWDQPGTGFLECLSSNIPTLVYWPRIYNHEETWTKPIFLELEQHGIVHRDIDSLLEEFQRFKESPDSWMRNVDRVELVNRFCRQFAWTSDDWPEYWRSYFDNLNKTKEHERE